MSKKLSIEELISRSREIHGTKYDYSLVNYVNKDDKAKIICQIHGIFLQSFASHIRKKCGCPNCSTKKKLTTKEFIIKCKLKHGDLYDYSLINYKNANTKVKIICKKHGVFEQKPNNHSCTGYGCPKCANKNKSIDEIINEFNIIHNYEYNYSLVNYKKSNIKIRILCKKHGEFKQTPNNHLNGQKCPKCSESNGESKIRLFLEQNNIKLIPEHRFKNCKDKYSLPFDFYLPEFNICIEFDGIQHFKSLEFFGGGNALKTQQKRDNIKTQYCLNNNIKLIRIRYDENIIEKLKDLISFQIIHST